MPGPGDSKIGGRKIDDQFAQEEMHTRSHDDRSAGNRNIGNRNVGDGNLGEKKASDGIIVAPYKPVGIYMGFAL